MIGSNWKEKLGERPYKIGDIVLCNDGRYYGIKGYIANDYKGYILSEKNFLPKSVEEYIVFGDEIVRKVEPSKEVAIKMIGDLLAEIKLPDISEVVKDNEEDNEQSVGKVKVKEDAVAKYNDSHYANMKVQPMEVIATWPIQQQIGFMRGNILKYTMRLGSKDKGISEASKILRYAEWLYQILSGEDIKLK